MNFNKVLQYVFKNNLGAGRQLVAFVYLAAVARP